MRQTPGLERLAADRQTVSEDECHLGARVAQVGKGHVQADQGLLVFVVTKASLAGEDMDESQLEEVSQVGEAVGVLAILARDVEARGGDVVLPTELLECYLGRDGRENRDVWKARCTM